MDLGKFIAATFLIAVISVPMIVNAAAVNGQGTWETTLLGRDLDGNATTVEAYYDTVLNITWLADANYAQTSGYDTNGLVTWSDANSWATSINPYDSGIIGWRLPNTNPIDGTTAYDYSVSSGMFMGTLDHGSNISAPGTLYAGSTASEMAHLYYNTLGNKAYYDTAGNPEQLGWGLSNTGLFSNLHADSLPYSFYWSATEYAPDTSGAVVFFFREGSQGGADKSELYQAWAVHSGDVGASVVPVPAAVWLFGSGLIGLIGIAKRKRTTYSGSNLDVI